MNTIKTNQKSKALVTGFSSGIGLAYSKYLALNNWQLELVAQNPEKSEMAFNAIKNKDSTYHLADLSKPEGVQKITNKVKDPDLIIANAGITCLVKQEVSIKKLEKIYFISCAMV